MQIRLKEWRERRFMTQEDLAQASGVGAATIARVETGQQRPTPKTIKRLAAALKIEPEQLVIFDAPAAAQP